MSDFSYIGVGKVYMREVGASAGLIEVGNCSGLSFSITEETKELKDFTQGGGGTYNEVRRVSAVECSMTLHDMSKENLARAVFGSSSANSVTAVTNEAHTAYKGALVQTNKPAASITAVTNVGGSTTYVLNTDYQVVPGGVLILAAGAITDASSIEIDYTPAASDVVEALTSSAKEYEMYFAGVNEARSGKSVNVHAYRVKLGAAQELSLIGEDYLAMELSGKVLKDTSKTGGVSQYFKVQIVT
jgi:hypothetical protein